MVGCRASRLAPPHHRRGARAWHRAHAESFACRGSVRGTGRGRAAHPARCHNRAAITHRINSHAHYPAARWGHRALPHHRRGARLGIPQNSHAHYPRALPCGAMLGRRGSPLAPYRHAHGALRTAIFAHGARALPVAARHRNGRPWGLPIARGGSPPAGAHGPVGAFWNYSSSSESASASSAGASFSMTTLMVLLFLTLKVFLLFMQ